MNAIPTIHLNAAAAPKDEAEPVFVAPAIPAALVSRLIQAGQTSADTNALADAAAQLHQAFAPDRPAEWLRAVLARAQIAGMIPLQLLWRRFDRGSLPALICTEGRWWLIEPAVLEASQVRLTDEFGQELVMEAESESLADAPVVWLRARPEAVKSFVGRSPAARMVLSEIFREPGWIAKSVLATIVINLLAVASSLFSMQVYDRVVPTMAFATLTTMVVGMLIVVAIDAFLKMTRARIVDSVSSDVDKRLSQRVFEHLMQIRLDQLPRGVGSLAAQVSGIDAVRQFFSSAVVFGIADLPFALMFMVFIAVIGGQVAWVYVVVTPMAVALGWYTHLRLRSLVKQQINRSNERQGVLVDAIRGAEAARAARAGWRFSQEWAAITNTIQAYNIQQKASHNTMQVGIASLSALATVAAVVVGVLEVQAGHLTTGGMIACSILGSRVIGPIAQAVQLLVQWETVSQSMAMVDRVLALPTERQPEQTLISPTLPQQGLVLKLDKIRYAYPESPVMHVNLPDGLSFRSGDRVVLVGPVGGGKSTLLKVMAGLFRPAEGRVRLGDIDIWEMDPNVLSAQVTYLPQDVNLFKGSLRSNIALSGVASDATTARIARELGVDQIAAAHPLGMDLPISEGGAGLSGGQRQLVALARIMTAQPRVWLLDEPTASLDGESESRVWAALARYVGPDDILIVATHKPASALTVVNRALVMQRGEVVRDGTPQEVFPKFFSQVGGSRAAAHEGGTRVGGMNVI